MIWCGIERVSEGAKCKTQMYQLLEGHADMMVRVTFHVADYDEMHERKWWGSIKLDELIHWISAFGPYYKPSPLAVYKECWFTAVVISLRRMIASGRRFSEFEELVMSEFELLSERELGRNTVPKAVLEGMWL
jgi:hypothetical protein